MLCRLKPETALARCTNPSFIIGRSGNIRVGRSGTGYIPSQTFGWPQQWRYFLVGDPDAAGVAGKGARCYLASQILKEEGRDRKKDSEVQPEPTKTTNFLEVQ